MAQGNYDHPSYLTRQQICLGSVVAGASGTSCHTSFLSAIRIRQAQVTVLTAGTVGTNVQAIIFNGTSAIGTASFGTSGATIGSVLTIADMNTTIAQGNVVAVKNGADATAVTRVVLEAYLDPAATWTGNN